MYFPTTTLLYLITKVCHISYSKPSHISRIHWLITSGDLLKWIIIIAGIILAAVIGYTVSLYAIDENWKIAITTFILLLPFSLFLQASLNVNAIRSERHREIQDALRKMYIKFYHNNQKPISEEILSDKDTFKKEFEKRANFLMEQDIRLYVIYQEAYQRFLKLDSNTQTAYRDMLLQFELGDILTDIIRSIMRQEGTNFGSYLLPLYFFLFMYFAGFLFTLPLVSSIFTQDSTNLIIPLYETNGQEYGIPLIVIQWGFLGGLVYTSIGLLNRFLRKDLTPRVYFNAAFRLILSSVVAIVIYFIFWSRGVMQPNEVQPSILLFAFLAGIAPIQLLINFADTLLSKISRGWRRRNTPGNRSIRRLDGINSVTAERLSEEGIDYVQQMALCDPKKLEHKTNFPLGLIKDWKEQAILYILSGDISLRNYKMTNIANDTKGKVDNSSEHNDNLNHVLSRKAGTRTISAFIDLWKDMSSKNDDSSLIAFFNSLGLLDHDSNNLLHLRVLFENVCKQGIQMRNENEDINSYNKMSRDIGL